MGKKVPGNKPVIKSNLKTSDRITLTYNNEEVEMSLADFKTYLNSSDNLGYKRYVAFLTQDGTSAPTAIVLENTLGGTVVWTRGGTGLYSGTLAGAFTLQKTTVFVSSTYGSSNVHHLAAYASDVNTITIETVTGGDSATDGEMDETAIEIRVYNS
jgi:hypothetical protein